MDHTTPLPPRSRYWLIYDGGRHDVLTGAELVAANVDDPDVLDVLATLQVGTSVRIGGGAMPLMTVWRTA